MLLLSPQMQANYRTFGDCVSFDITYKVCSYYKSFIRVNQQGENTKEDRYWNLGVFSVFMEDCRPLICGICFILQETADDFVQLFTLFRDTAGKIEGAREFPESIITDQQKAMISALDKLK